MSRHRQGANAPDRLPLVRAYAILLAAATAYVLLDAFVIARSFAPVQDAVAATVSTDMGQGAADQEESAQVGGGLSPEPAEPTQTADADVSLSQVRYLDTTVYVVDVYANDVTQLLAALADDTYGKNVTEKTSEMAQEAGAKVAINGDYYGARNAGYVVRNGVLYRSEVASADQEDLVIYLDGTFEVVREGDVSAQELVDAGAWQVYSFGPGLVSDGAVTVDAGDEVGRAMASNPRTAIGKVADGHYVLVVADGRTSESEGLSLAELATFMHDELGVDCAYNLDGGGSSTLYYDGAVVNNPTTSGRSTKERSVSDIVYVAG